MTGSKMCALCADFRWRKRHKVRTSRAERGSATVYAAIIITALSAVCLLMLTLSGIVRLDHEASRAADLAAVAGAEAALDGDEGCASARDVARRNGVRLVTCELAFEVVTVTVQITSQRVLGRRWTFNRTARAAPADLMDAS